MDEFERTALGTGLVLVVAAAILSAIVGHAEPVLGAVGAFIIWAAMLLLFRWMERDTL